MNTSHTHRSNRTFRTPWARLSTSATLFALSGVLSFAAAANAGVDGAKIKRGDVSFSQDGNTLRVRASNGAIIEYNRFSVEAGQIMQFIQPSATSRVLNRVTGSELSRIDGSLLSNGIVYLVNPQGIRIGNGALINVGGFYAAAGAMSDKDFIRGNNNFTNLSGKVVNEGMIHAQAVALVGQYVANRGTIQVDDGVIAMASGDTVFLQHGTGPIMVTVNRSQLGADSSGAGTEAGVSNTGTINAGKGKVAMTSGDFYALAMDLSGTIIGKSIAARGGKDGVVAVNGTLDASSTTGKGGTVDIFGDRVGLFGDALVNANGATGGGSVRIGGDYLGTNAANAPQANRTVIGTDARITANATQSGDGGRVIVWSNEYTGFFGSIDASTVGIGKGGFIETSSHDNLQAFGSVNAKSARGKAGTWLLDPSDVTITNSADAGGSFDSSSPNVFTPTAATATADVATINSSLNGGTSVTINTGSVGDGLGGAGNITLAAAIEKIAGGNATLSLNAVGSITLSASITSTVGALSVALNAGTTVSMGAITTNGGDVNVNAGGGVFVANNVITSGTGEINITGNTNSALRSQFGVNLREYVTIQTTDGALNITGTGGTDAGGLNWGIYTNAGDIIRSIGSGNVTVTGTGGTSGYGNDGVLHSTYATITSNSGFVLVKGTGGSNQYSSGVKNYGTITSSGTGSVAVEGVAGNVGDTNSNYGVVNAASGAGGSVISSSGGTVTVVGTGAAGWDAINLFDTSSITSLGALTLTSNGGAINQVGGTIRVDGATTITAGTNDVTLAQSTNDFVGAVSVVSANNVSLADANTLTLGASTVANNFTATASGGIVVADNVTAGGTGAINITGNTNVNPALRSIVGVTVNNGVTIQSTNGNLSITGTGGSEVGGYNYGVYNNGATITSAGVGNVTVEGTGGSSDAVYNLGVHNLGTITSATTGSVTVTGRAGSGSRFAYGVSNTGSGQITSGGGDVFVTGTGGSGTNSAAIFMNNGSIIAPAALTLTSNGGAINQVGGTITVNGTTTITAGTNDVTLAQSTNDFVGAVSVVSANNVSLADANTLTLGASTVGNNFTATAAGGVVVAGNLTAGGTGAINITGNTNVTPALRSIVGVTVNNGVTIQSTNGNLIITGTGGADVGGNNYGVYNVGTITSSGIGNVTVTGTGGNGADGENLGVLNQGVDAANKALITSGGGNVVVTGTGGTSTNATSDGVSNDGIYMINGKITSGGAGSVTVTGIGGESVPGRNHGIRNKGTITSGGMGEVIVRGTGGTSTGDVLNVPNSNYGIINKDGAEIKSGGGAVTMIGVGGNGADGMNYGIQNMTLATIQSGGTGSVTVTGTGGNGSGGLGKDNYGVYNFGSEITSGGDLTITGNGGNGVGGFNNGVYSINDGPANGAITSGGNLVITGTGGAGAAGFNAGVYTRHTELISSGSMAITGEGGTGGTNVAIVLVDGPINVGGNFSATASLTAGSTNSKILIEAPITTTNGGAVDMNARAGALSIEDTGVINSDGVVTLTAGGGISTAGNVTTTGDDVNYESATTLTGDILVRTGTGTGDITFVSTIDAAALGTQTLTVNAAEDAIFNGNIGAISSGTALGALTVTAGGKIKLNSAIVNTANTAATGDQLFNSAVVLGNLAGSTLTSTGGGDITFVSTIDAAALGTQTLTVNAAEDAIFNGNIGNGTALGALTVTAGGKINLNSAIVNTERNAIAGTTGNQLFNSAVVLGNLTGSTLTSTGLGAIDFASTIDAAALGTQTLTVNAAEDAIFDGNIGNGTALGALTVTADTNGGVVAGTIQLNSAIVNTERNAIAGTTGDQLFNSAVVLGNLTGSTLTSNGGGDIQFISTLDGDKTLALRAGNGDITFTGAVGAVTRLGAITITSAQNVTAGGGVAQNSFNASTLTLTSVTGTATFTGPLNLTTLSLTHGVNNFSSTGTTGTITNAVAFTNTGNLTLGQTGGIQTFTNGLDTTGVGGSVTMYGTFVTGGGPLNFSNLVLPTDTVFNSSGYAINFNGTVNGTTAGAQTLGLIAGAGNIQFVGIVGGVTPLGAITITSANNVTAFAAITASSFTQVAGTGTTTFNGITTTTAGALNVTTNNVTFNDAAVTYTDMLIDVSGLLTMNMQNSTQDESVIGRAFAQTGTGNVFLQGGGPRDSEVLILGLNSFAPVFNATFTGAVTIDGSVGIGAGSGSCNVHFLNTVDSAVGASGNLAVDNGNIVFDRNVGAIRPLGTFEMNIAQGESLLVSGTLTAQTVVAGPIPNLLQTPLQTTSTFEGLITTGNYDGAAPTDLNIGTNTVTLNGGMTTLDGGDVFVAGHTINFANGTTIASDGSIEIMGDIQGLNNTLNLGADMTTTGGEINFQISHTVLTDDVSINSAGGNITFGGTLNGTLASRQSLDLTAGTGDILFIGDVRGALNGLLGTVSVLSAHNVMFNGRANATSFIQNTGTGTTTFNGAVTLTKPNVGPGGNFYFNGNALVMNGVSVVGNNFEVESRSGVVIAADVTTLGTGTINITSNTLGLSQTGVTVNGGVTIQTTDGDLNITGMGGSVAGGYNYGVYNNGGTITSGGAGRVFVNGIGGGGGVGSSNNWGIANAGTIGSGTDGNVFVEGAGGFGDGGSHAGIFNFGMITSGGIGNVTVRGVAGDGGGLDVGVKNTGISSTIVGTITSGGAGSVTVSGFGGIGAGGNSGVENVNGATITSGGGDVAVTGAGGDSDGDRNYGVLNANAALITSGGGAVLVTGRGGNGASEFNHGVRNEYGSITSGGAGSVTVTGTGGSNAAGGVNDGVVNFGTITSGGAGSVTVTGTGGSGVGGVNVGVYNFDTITSGAGGNVTVTGTGGSGDGGLNYGVYNSGTITSGAGGNVEVTGTGGSGDEAIYMDSGFITAPGALTLTSNGGAINQTGGTIEVSGATTLKASVMDTDIHLAGGPNDFAGSVTIDNTAGAALNVHDFELRNINATPGVITNLSDATNLSDFTIWYDNAGYTVPLLTMPSLHNVNITTGAGVVVANNVTAGTDGEINITGNTNVDPALRNQWGVTVSSNVIIQTTGGDLNITGTGGSNAGGSNFGVYNVGGTIRSGGVGNVTVEGTGGSGLGNNYGVYNGDGTIRSGGGGNVFVTGTGGSGGNQNLGVYNNGIVSSLGSGDVTVTGTGGSGANNGAIFMDRGFITAPGVLTLTSNGGAINQTGGTITVDGATTLKASVMDTDISLAGGLLNNFAGTVTIDNTAGAAMNVRDFMLRNVNAAAGEITNLSNASNLRDFTIMYDNAGYTVPLLTMASLRNVNITTGAGVVVANNVITGGKGEINITGNTNANTSLRNTVGVNVFDNVTIQTTNGNLNITGTGGSANSLNWGIFTSLGDTIRSIGSGNVTVTGTGGIIGTGNYGVLHSTGATITSGSGNVLVKGTGGSNLGAFGINNYGTITSGGTGSVTVEGVAGNVGDTNSNYGVVNAAFGAGGGVISSSGGTVTVVGTGAAGWDAINLYNTSSITSLGALTLTSNGGAINQVGGTIEVDGTTTISVNVASTDISLAGGPNNFAGPVNMNGNVDYVRDFKLRDINSSAGAANPDVTTFVNLRDLTIAYDDSSYVLPSLTMPSLRNVSISAIDVSMILNRSLTTHNGGTVTFNATNQLNIADGANIFAEGEVNLTGTDGIFINGDITTTGKGVSFHSATQLTDNTLFTIDTTNGNLNPNGANIFFSDAITVLTDNTEALILNAGTVGEITLTGHVGEPTRMLSNLTLTAANTIIKGDIYVAGNTTAGDITIINDTIIESKGSLTVGSIDGGGYAVNISTVDLILTAPITDVTTLTIQNSDPTGAITLMGLGGLSLDQTDWNFIGAGVNVVLGSSNYTGTVTVDGAWTNNRAVTVAFQPGSVGHFTVDAPITGSGSLTINGSGHTTTLAADIIQNSIHITDAVEVNAALVTLIATAGDIVIDGSITSANRNNLTVNASENVELLGNIGTSVAHTQLGTLTVDSGTNLGNTITFGALASTVYADNVKLNTGASSALATAATMGTIVSDGNIEYFTNTFAMGQNHKLTSLGGIRISGLAGSTSNATSVALGDVNAVGNLRVNANSITLLGRAGGPIVTNTGGTVNDARLDYVVGGRAYFSVAPIMGGTNPGNRAMFSNPTGNVDALGTLSLYATTTYPSAITSGLLTGVGGQVLDLSASSGSILFYGNPATIIPQMMSSLPPIGLLGNGDTLDDDEEKDAQQSADKNDDSQTPATTQAEKAERDVPVNVNAAAVPVALR